MIVPSHKRNNSNNSIELHVVTIRTYVRLLSQTFSILITIPFTFSASANLHFRIFSSLSPAYFHDSWRKT